MHTVHRSLVLHLSKRLLEALQVVMIKYPTNWHIDRWIKETKKLLEYASRDDRWGYFDRDHSWQMAHGASGRDIFFNTLAYAAGMLYGIRVVEQTWHRRLTDRDIDAINVVIYHPIYPCGVIWRDEEKNGDRVGFIAYDFSQLFELTKKDFYREDLSPKQAKRFSLRLLTYALGINKAKQIEPWSHSPSEAEVHA